MKPLDPRGNLDHDFRPRLPVDRPMVADPAPAKVRWWKRIKFRDVVRVLGEALAELLTSVRRR